MFVVLGSSAWGAALLRSRLRMLLGLLAASLGWAQTQPPAYTIPTIDLAGEFHRQTVVDREPGQYLGHPTTALLPDGRTILAVYPKGHGRGGIVYKRSADGGLTWSERLAVPENWATSREVPTLYRVPTPEGGSRLLMFSGGPPPVRMARSEDDGATWTPLEPIGEYGGIVAMGSLVVLRDGRLMALFHDDGRWLRDPPEYPEGKHFVVYKTLSADGGLTWSAPVEIARHAAAYLCEPGAVRSPDGKQIAVLLRENSRKLNSFVVFSDDEGATWTPPRELPAALTGDRHTAKYAPDGRLVISFRDTTRESPTGGDWVAWVGQYSDIVEGREGQYRVRLMDNRKSRDTAYPGVEVLPDGTFVATTYGHWVEEESPFIMSVRWRLDELDFRARFLRRDTWQSQVVGTDVDVPPVTMRPAKTDGAGDRPNILFIAVDDLNDWAVERDSPLHLPNLRRLERMGVRFEHAYTASPACNPSRTALLTGVATARSGVYDNRSRWREAIPGAITLPRYFQDNGYRVEGAGKIFHHHRNSAWHDAESFHRYEKLQADPMPSVKLNRTEAMGGNFDWGQWPGDESKTPDARSATYAEQFLARQHDKPFFLAIGLFRPHMPFHAPPASFRHYPEAAVTMPRVFDDDLADLPSGAFGLLGQKAHFFDEIRRMEQARPGTWRASVRAYQASASFADKQLGRVLDALAASPYAANTVIVLWSDHGYHLGEKGHWEKFALWERSTRVPLVMAVPGVTRPGSVSRRPVSLLDVYPTLVELAGLPANGAVDGVSLAPLLQEPDAAWDRPAVMTYQRGNHAVRSERWRYIRYADGTEELYDHASDPDEWHNLARDPGNANVAEELRAWLPKNDAADAALFGR